MKKSIRFSLLFIVPFLHAEVIIKFGQMKEVIDLAKPFLPQNPIIIDAGAYDGGDSKIMNKYLSKLNYKPTIFAFEPDPNNFVKLKNNTKRDSNIHCFECALSDKNGSALFYQSDCPSAPGISFSGSLLKPKEHLNYSETIFPTTVYVETITLDDWAIKQGIDHIDLLCFDMQGMELPVLMAAPEILKTVKVVYTEVELVEAYEGQYLYWDILEWLENQDFTLIAKDFNENDPTVWFGNILMARIEK